MIDPRYLEQLDRARQLAERSPAEAISDEIVQDLPQPLDSAPLRDEAVVFRPWEPKGEAAIGVPPPDTIVSAGIKFGDPPPKTAGGSPPRHHKRLGVFGPDDGSV